MLTRIRSGSRMEINLDRFLKEVQQMIQDITLKEDHFLVNLSGDVYAAEAAQLRESMIIYLQTRHKNIVIDFGDVDYIDSAGLGTLVAIQKRALENGGSVVIKGLQGIVKELFELTKLT